MKLLKLYANNAHFKTLIFKPSGLTLIIGDAGKNHQQDSGNGVGKTLAMNLVHYCLGSNEPPSFKEKLKDWIFYLIFEHDKKEYFIERAVGGKIILNNKPLTLNKYREWLNESGIFYLNNAQQNLTFRALISRFLRLSQEDCQLPTQTHKEPEVDAQLRTFFLLGLDYKAIDKKREDKKRLDSLKDVKKLENDPILQNVFRVGAEPQLRIDFLNNEIPRLEKDLEEFELAVNYRTLEKESEDLTKKLDEVKKQINIRQFQLNGIEKSLQQKPDMSRIELLSLYEGLQIAFKTEMLEHFEKVESFHHDFFENRKNRLQADKKEIEKEINKLENDWQEIAKSRDNLLKELSHKRALDEYAALSNHLAQLKAERAKLEDYLNFKKNNEQEILKTKQIMLEEDNKTSQYVNSNPILQQNEFFKAIANQLYPRVVAGIVLENNTGENQLRYKLAVQIEGDASDGINSARILCFDWLLLMKGENHHIDFLWHDSRLFADMGTNPRVAWFRFVLHELANIQKQYIVSLNKENYENMLDSFNESEKNELEKSVILKLKDDSPINKLLGIQF